MPPEIISETLRRQPFQPFRIHLINGHVYEVKHPESVMTGKHFLVVGIFDHPGSSGNGTGNLIDRYETVATIHIARLEPIGSPLAQ
jgi:hypothetical protein